MDSLLPHQDRKPGPKELYEVSMGTRRRWLESENNLPERRSYRPPTLEGVAHALDVLDPALLGIGQNTVLPPGTFRLYQVRRNDTLRSLATHFYGHADDWKRIYDANMYKLDNPDRIYAGQLLRIPLDDAPASNTRKPVPSGAGFAERYSSRSAEVRRG